MAAQGAHLTSTAAENGDRPSIFEVLAQDSLVLALRPALQHVIRILAEKNPARYGRLYIYSEELYIGLQLILENYYLKHYSSSFSENFYGMKRVLSDKRKQQDDAEHHTSSRENAESEPELPSLYKQLPASNRLRSLAFLVLVPYMKSKCDKWFESLKENSVASNDEQVWKRRLCRAFLVVYPLFHLMWESALLAYQLGYVFGRVRVHTPLLKWAGVLLQHLDDNDYARDTKPLTLAGKSWLEVFRLVTSRVLSGLALTLSSGLSVGVFFLQFLEWWYASDQHASTLTALPNPPAPKAQKNVTVPKLHTLCPLCRQVRTNDTVLAVSGYVFCYTCISRYVSESQCCPVTRYPATSDHLVRLYLPDR